MVAQQKYATPEDYLKFERQSETKHEYFNGEIFAMTGASEKHNLITGNVGTNLHAQLRPAPSEVFMSAMRVKTASNIYVYPDIVVVRGKVELEGDEEDTVLNPTVIIEVLSASSEGHDRGKKFQAYRIMDSVQEYFLISQESFYVEHYVRRGSEWLFTDAVGLAAVVTLPSINCTLALTDIYEKVIDDIELAEMAADPDIQRVIDQINAEFADTEFDGLSEKS